MYDVTVTICDGLSLTRQCETVNDAEIVRSIFCNVRNSVTLEQLKEECEQNAR